jgi:hypothetical protein
MKQDKHMIWEIHPHHATSSPARAVPKVLDPFCGSGTVLIDAGHAKLSLVFTQNNGIYHVDPFWDHRRNIYIRADTSFGFTESFRG